MALTQPIATPATAEAVRRRLQGSGPDVKGIAFRTALQLALAFAVLVLIVLLLDVVLGSLDI